MFTLNILMDELRQFPHETQIPLPSQARFSHPSLLPRDFARMRPELLYVCRLSEGLRAAAERPELYFICLRDRIKDTAEGEQLLRRMVIINENMDFETLFTGIQDAFFRINDWQQKMQEALIRNKPLQEIIDLSEEIIGNTINISDSAFTLLACTWGIPTDEEVTLSLRAQGYHTEATLQLFRKYRRYEVWDSDTSFIINDKFEFSRYVLVNKVFRFHNTYFTHVVMVCDHHPLSPGLLDRFQMLTDVLAVYAERNWEGKSSLSHNYDSFLTDLLEGRLVKKSEIDERAQYIGLPAAGPFGLMKLATAPGLEVSLGRIGRELSEMVPGSQVILYQQTLVMLFRFQDGCVGFGALEEHLSRFLTQYQARAGISDRFSGLEQLRVAHFQASLALKYSSQLRGRELLSPMPGALSSPVLCPYQDRILHCLLGENPHGEEIWHNSIYGAGLLTLADYDSQHGTNNLQLLRAYLWFERKATETGALLHMHRNNVIYRIGRIEKMLGLDLNDHHVRLGLELSFLLLEMYGLPCKPAGGAE